LNKYKRIFHHIDFKEAKSKHLEDVAVKKLEEEKNIKKEKQISKITEEKKYSWRETLKEAEWVALDTGGIANKTTQTFGLTDLGFPVMGPGNMNQVTANFGGLGGVDVHPSEVGYNGMEGEPQTTPPPTYNQLALAGFTKPLPMLRRQDKLKADEINARLDSSQQVAQKANADYYMNARLEADKKYEEELDKWDKEKEAVDAYNRNLDDEYEKEKERVRVYNERIMMAHHRTMAGVKWDSKRKMGIPTNTPHPGSDLDISNRLNAKYWIPGENGGRGVMTITDQEWAKLHCEMGGCANEAKRKALEKKIKLPPERPTYKEYPPKPEPPNNVIDPNILTKIPGASTAVVFDYYLNWLNKTKGGNSTVQDLSNLMSEEDKDWLRDFLDHIKSTKGKITFADGVFQDRTKKDDDQDFGVGDSKADDDNGGIPFGIRNIIGDIDLGRGEGFSEDADYYYVNKKYDFENWKDTVAPGVGYLSTYYAWAKGLGKWMGKGEHGTPTMYMVIKIPKKKKKKK
tara:strand:- start:98 stop:1639 length:1542 start_codon:yes stop_codon:yes gene_type:complete